MIVAPPPQLQGRALPPRLRMPPPSPSLSESPSQSDRALAATRPGDSPGTPDDVKRQKSMKRPSKTGRTQKSEVAGLPRSRSTSPETPISKKVGPTQKLASASMHRGGLELQRDRRTGQKIDRKRQDLPQMRIDQTRSRTSRVDEISPKKRFASPEKMKKDLAEMCICDERKGSKLASARWRRRKTRTSSPAQTVTSGRTRSTSPVDWRRTTVNHRRYE